MRAGIDDVARAAVFDEHLTTCHDEVRNIVAFLRDAAAYAGEGIELPTFEVRGVGVTYWTAGKWFCRFDLKPKHVWVHFPNAERSSTRTVGVVSQREDGVWLTIEDMKQAVRLVPAILQSHDNVVASRRERKR